MRIMPWLSNSVWPNIQVLSGNPSVKAAPKYSLADRASSYSSSSKGTIEEPRILDSNFSRILNFIRREALVKMVDEKRLWLPLEPWPLGLALYNGLC